MFYDEPLRRLTTITDNWIHIVDVLLVAYLVWRLLRLVRGTRAWRILTGILVFVIALALSEAFGLRTLHWVLEKAALLGPVALVILFLPELRQTIEGFARFGGISDRIGGLDRQNIGTPIEEIATACMRMAKSRTGALIVMDRGSQLEDIARNGVPVRAVVSSALLEAIFYMGNPLHDGAVIIRKDEIVAAACQLPLSDNPEIHAKYHMRHRAGVGITEQSDAVSIMVSEERGQVSVATAGSLTIMKDGEQLSKVLNDLLRIEPKPSRRRKKQEGAAS